MNRLQKYLLGLLLTSSLVAFESPRGWLPYAPSFSARFDSNGTVSIDPLGDEDGIRAGIWTSDNKLLVVGWSSTGLVSDYALARLWPDGTLDTGFDSDGIATTTFGVDAYIHGVVEDSSGNYVVVGRRADVGSSNMLVSRYLTNGSVDLTFGVAGHRQIDFGPGNNDSGRALKIDGSGRIVAVGFSNTGTGWDMAVARLTAAGALDAAFGGGTGMVLSDFPDGHDDRADAVYVDASDEIWAVGHANADDPGVTHEDFAMARFLTDGSLDTQIITDSPGTAPAQSNERAWGVDVDSLGRVIAVGRVYNSTVSEWELAAVRYSAAGAFDAASATNISNGAIARSVHVKHNRYYVAGRAFDGTDWDMMIARLLTTGSIDGGWAFGGSNVRPVSANDDAAMAIISEGDLLYSIGWSQNATKDFSIVRWNANGGEAGSTDGDIHISLSGEIATDFGSALVERAFAFAYDSAGSLGYAAAGYQQTGGGNTTQEFAVIKWASNGVGDTTWSTDGLDVQSISTADRERAQAAVFDGSGRLLVAGWAEFGGGGTRDSVVIRYNVDGTLDTSFSGDGILQTDFAADRDEVHAMAIDTFGNILLAGVFEVTNAVSREMMVVRLRTDGSMDTHFGGDGIAITNFAGETWARAIAVDTNGRIVVAGYTEVGGTTTLERDVAVARFHTNGALDTSFSGDGMFTTSISTANADESYGAAIDNLGRVVVVGPTTPTATGDRDIFTMRLTSNGVLDAGFNTTGIHTYSRGTSNQDARDVTFQPNNKILVNGRDGGNWHLARFHTDGSLDTSWDTDGIFREDIAGNDDFYGIQVLPDGRYVAGGRTGDDMGFIRVWP